MSLNLRRWLAESQVQLNKLLSPGAEVSGVAFRIVQDMDLKSLTPFDICPVADVLELPLRANIQVSQPVAQLTIGLLRLLSRKKPLKRAEGTWLTFQVSYLNALQEILEQEAHLRRPWIDRANVPVGKDIDQPFNDPKLQGLLQTLRPGRLTDSQAEQALARVGDSFLVQQMNKLAIAWLGANGTEDTEAHLIAQRLVNGLPGHLLAIIAENAIPLAQLQKFVRLGDLRSLGITHSGKIEEDSLDKDPEGELAVDLEREQYRAGLIQSLSQPMLGATFSLKDIYVPLKGTVIAPDLAVSPRTLTPASPPPAPEGQTVDLSAWVTEQLQNPQSIAAIEAESGWGKTSFCQIFAAEMARERYPEWMPVFIRLRDVELGQTLEETLESACPQGRFADTDGWLSSQGPPLLLILDGLDELPPSPRKLRHYFVFIDQLMQFHAQCLSHQPPLKHKILLTSRGSTFEGLTRRHRVGSLFPLQTQLERIVIQPMDREALQQWFIQWSKLQSKQISHRYFSFLRDEGLFSKRFPKPEIALLVHQPLMLYLLGVLHRDGLLDKELFDQSLPPVKFEIYERITRWLLGETQGRKLLPEGVREGMAHANRGSEAIANLLAGRHPQQTRDLMQQIALTLLQTGDWKLKIEPNETELLGDRWPDAIDRPLPALFFSKPIHPLAPFVVEGVQIENSISFSHASLGGYLAAVALAKRLQVLVEQTQDRYGEISFAIDSPQAVAQHLYNLLGYGPISTEIETLLVEYLQRQERRNAKAFSLVTLCDRLERFYRSYCQGRWLDEGIPHETHQHLQRLRNSLNVLQVDAAVGLNVFLLLCALSQAASVPFWPCGDPNKPQEFDADRLLTFISRVSVLSPTCFFLRARHSLSRLQLVGACLNRAVLSEANLEGTNLSVAELDRANLVGANLTQANLSWASLVGADLHQSNLSQANLEGANLCGANLMGVNLSQANLANACLYGAELDPTNRQLARRRGAFFTWEAFQDYSQSLVNTLQVGDFSDLGASGFLEMDSAVQIEVAEGEPILPNIWDEDRGENRRYQQAGGVVLVEHHHPDAPTVGSADPNAPTLAEEEGELQEDETLADRDFASDAPTLAEESNSDLPTEIEEGGADDDDATWVAH